MYSAPVVYPLTEGIPERVDKVRLLAALLRMTKGKGWLLSDNVTSGYQVIF